MIDEMGRLELPLYHGTSSYFLAQIREHGLGGYRDSKLFDAEILANLADSLDNSQNSTAWWELNSFVVRPMLERRVTSGGFNFRYGNTYLSSSRSTACGYATSNPFGSEFLSIIYQAYMALASVNTSQAETILPHNHPLRCFFRGSHRPILLTLQGAPAEKLRTEQGDPIEDQLQSIISICNAGLGRRDALLQQLNFELEGSIDFSLLDVTILDEGPTERF
ncbi:hypothetical protein [Marinobacter sp.]|uniref:hypothetical protein n=1 Tax=Marinobacter sp. TaxID=50741 RepID=UPI0035C662CC